MKTADAQRGVLCALAALNAVEDGTKGLLIGCEMNIPVARQAGQPEIAEVYAVLGDLAAARMGGEDGHVYERRLLERLSSVDRSGTTGLGRLIVGLRHAAGLTRGEVREVGGVFDALADLAGAVQGDRKEKSLA